MMRSTVMRASLVVLSVAGAAPAVAEGLSGWYAQGEGGIAVEVPFAAARVGRELSDQALCLDAGLTVGSSFTMATFGLEARAWPRRVVSPYGRTELGGLSSGGRGYLVLSLGAGLAFRLDDRWSARIGITRSLDSGDSVSGPDSVQIGLEYRW